MLVAARVALAAGCLLRLAQYLFDRSLWLDETFIALNILERGYRGLLGALDYNQGAPVGFLFLTKSLVLALGSSEYVLRLVPLAAGIASLFLFDRLCRVLLSDRSRLVAVSLLAVCDPLIYYASEVKQYASDVALALVLLVLGASLHRRRSSDGMAVWFGALSMTARPGLRSGRSRRRRQ